MEENMTTFMSAEINEITAALSAFQGEVEQPKLNKENPYFKSRYVDLSGVLNAVQPILAKNNLCVAQLIVGNDLVTMLSHKSGQWFKSVCPIGTYKSQQDRGSAITYTKRYAICALLGIAADTDDDGNSATDTDTKSGGVQQPAKPSKGAPVFTGAQLKQALDELAAITDAKEIQTFWQKWNSISPAMCGNGSELYKAVAKKSSELKTQNA